MNKRIGELAEQAALLGPGSRIGNAHEATERFAELIIRECAEFSRNYNLEKAERSYMIHKAIKEHFGVDQ